MAKATFHFTLFFAFIVLLFAIFSDFEVNPKSDHPLFNASTPEAVRHYGYPIETHTLTTEDGYILDIHRIPRGHGPISGQKRKAVLIHHALLCSSFNWVVNPPQQSLTFALANAGYDVWLLNVRGNIYGQRHIKHSSNSPEFWDFSFAEMGTYDIPAAIDYILKLTGLPSLHYIGHSMGTTTFFVMMSKRPEYSEKVEAMFALGPSSTPTINNLKSPVKHVIHLFPPFARFLNALGIYTFLPSSDLVNALGQTFCKENDLTQPLCEHVIYSLAGYSDEVNKTMLPVYVTSTPAGTSLKNIVHYMQAIAAEKFQEYDYGTDENLKRYGEELPREYDLTKSTIPVFIYHSQNDWLAQPKDVLDLAARLPNVKMIHRIEEEDFNHVDYMWGVNNKMLVYDHILKQMKLIERSHS